MSAVGEGLVTVFLCGDVMTGRAIDQVLPHPEMAEDGGLFLRWG
jgi:poly-gamma-glutamate capsule biosynthesis protein CapA/YwtB (metallophosphatase superfamily)